MRVNTDVCLLAYTSAPVCSVQSIWQLADAEAPVTAKSTLSIQLIAVAFRSLLLLIFKRSVL